jgi:hypothetical protein
VAQATAARAQLDLAYRIQLVELIERATPIVENFATAVCQNTDTSRTIDRAEVRATLQARLPGVLGRIADIGGGLEGELAREASQGVLAQDLADLLAQQRECRQTLSEALLARIVPQETTARTGPGEEGSGASDPNAFVRLEVPALLEIQEPSLQGIAVKGELHWFQVGFVKQTDLALMGCGFEAEIVGPTDLAAATRALSRSGGRKPVFIDAREPALETSAPTRIGVEIGVVIPDDLGDRPRQVDVEVMLDCANYQSPRMALRLPVTP